jgi:chromosome segregation protein
MAPLLKSLLGNGSKAQHLPEEMRGILHEMRQERAHFETLVKSARSSVDRLQDLGAPIVKAQDDVNAVTSRLGAVDERLVALEQVAARLYELDGRADGLAKSQRHTEARVAHVADDAQRVRVQIEELGHKVDLALDLKERLADFLALEEPFLELRGDADGIKAQVDSATDQLSRLREQQERVLDAHKAAFAQAEAFERRHHELSKTVDDKERRVAKVEDALKGLADVMHTIEDAKRRLGTLKALGDYVAQKTATLEEQRSAVDAAMARAEQLEQAMHRVDAGVRKQQENAQALGALQGQVAELQTLHEAVVQRSGEIATLQGEIDEQQQVSRQELAATRDAVKQSTERFEFERRSIDSVSQRVVDLRAGLSECETRFRDLGESTQAVGDLRAQAQTLTAQLGTIAQEVSRLDDEAKSAQALRRELDDVRGVAQDMCERVARIDEARPAMEAVIRDADQLGRTHAMVKEALEQSQVAHAEMARMREGQAETRSWVAGAQQSLGALREEVGELHKMAPTVEFVQKQVHRVNESMSAIEAQRGFVEEVHRRMTDLASVAGTLDERGRGLQSRMDTAEQRFVGLAAHAEEAERLGKAVATVTSSVEEAERTIGEIGKAMATVESRCESLEGLAERMRSLRQEVDQRQHALEEAAKDLHQASELRQHAAAAAQEMEQRAKKLQGGLAAAEKQAARVTRLTDQIEDRAGSLRFVEKRLGQFEERLGKWELVEQEIGRALEQISSRQSTVEALQADIERMFVMAEKTAADVRSIGEARSEIAESRTLLEGVLARLREVRDVAATLDERKRQMGQAEERLARADALLIDVRSSLEALQGQKVIVDQAMEKTGSLRFLLKQAEATVEMLREEREMTARVRAAVASANDDEEKDRDVAKKAG